MNGSDLPSILNALAHSASIAFGVSMGVAALLVLTRRWHIGFTGDSLLHLPQKAHRNTLPRIGGVAVVSGFAAGLIDLGGFRAPPGMMPAGTIAALLVSLLPVAACGFAEDITKRVGPRQRLVWMTLGALCLSGSGFLVLQRTDVPPIDTNLSLWPFAVMFTAFVCVGAANAHNIIDGLDGLLGGIALISLASISWVAVHVGDRAVLSIAALLGLAILGWLPFNWPRATLLAGDGGAYAIGFLTAVALLMLVTRHTDVSPWFGLTAAALPVCETLYSIWRRARAGRSTLEPDQAHLHQLVRVQMHRVREQRASRGRDLWPADGAPSAPPVTAPNGLCSPVLWLLHGGVALAGAAVYDDTNAQLKLFGAFVLTYVLVHRLLLRARTNLAYAAAR